MRYLVIVQRGVPAGEVLGPGCDGSGTLDGEPVPEDEIVETVVERVVPCGTTREVAAAIRAVSVENAEDCSLWEVTPKGVRSRAWVPKMDGRCLYDVEIS